MIKDIFSILIFPGFLFVCLFGIMAEYVDRKLYARLQNRVGPPWYQVFADMIKLIAKEDVVPKQANSAMFKAAPVFALSSAITAFFYIPMWGAKGLFSFNGDAIIVLYLLTLPTLAIFIGGWYSSSVFARLGSARALTQLFAYEVPLFMGILAPALLANTWSLSEIVLFYEAHPLYCIFNIPGFVISLIALMGKLEKAPFDIPEAETEIVAGSFVEYGGRLLAVLKLTLDVEMIVCSSLLAAVFFPFGLELGFIAGFIFYIIKVLAVVALVSLLRTVFARMRMDQMVDFCWKYLAPLALLQILFNIYLKGVFLR